MSAEGNSKERARKALRLAPLPRGASRIPAPQDVYHADEKSMFEFDLDSTYAKSPIYGIEEAKEGEKDGDWKEEEEEEEEEEKPWVVDGSDSSPSSPYTVD
jgi:hypothetical protein